MTLTISEAKKRGYHQLSNTYRISEKYPKAKVMIFNRWGDKLYDFVGLYNSQAWTGQYKGQTVPAGTYYYIIELNDISAVESIKKGTVTIIE